MRVEHRATNWEQTACGFCGYWCLSKYFIDGTAACRKCADDATHGRLEAIRQRRRRCIQQFARNKRLDGNWRRRPS